MKKIFLILALLMQLKACNVNESKVSSAKKDEIKNPIAICSYQNEVLDLGRGLLIWEGDCKDSIRFYIDTLDIYTKCSICPSTKLCPLFYKPDYSLANYVVLEKSEKFFKILANYSDQIYIEKSDDFTFASWDNVFSEHAVSIRIKGDKTVYDVKSKNGDILFCEEQISRKKISIKWRSKNELLIEIMFLI